jgi:hypothetical protein
MLYDHQIDPAVLVNIADRPDVTGALDRLASELKARKGRDGRFE